MQAYFDGLSPAARQELTQLLMNPEGLRGLIGTSSKQEIRNSLNEWLAQNPGANQGQGR